MSEETPRSVPEMYSAHPSPAHADKLGAADRRTPLRLRCCGVERGDYVGKDVLDAGCGTGEYAVWFAAKGASVTGIDLSRGALDEARAYAGRSGIDRASFEERSVLDTGFPDESFDFVYCTGVLHHTPAPFGGFRELCRVLRPGGKVLVSLYNRAGCLPRHARWRLVRLLADDDPDDRVRWGRRIFPRTAERLRDPGLSDPETRVYDYFGVDRQSLHTLGEVLGWLERCGLSYCGSFPPAELSDYPAMCSDPAYGSVEEQFKSPIQRWMARLGRSAQMRRRAPGVLDRTAVQAVWLAAGVGLFCVCGAREARRAL